MLSYARSVLWHAVSCARVSLFLAMPPVSCVALCPMPL